MDNRLVVQLENIGLKYHNVNALDGIDFNLFKNEIHGLYGEHGVGKSSLAKIIGGAIGNYTGTYLLDGQRIGELTIEDAVKRGIIMVYQDTCGITPYMSVIDNIYLRNFKAFRYFGARYSKTTATCREFFEKYDIDLDCARNVSTLSIQERNLLDVVSVLINKPRVVIFDEISNKLQRNQLKTVSRMMLDLKAEGTSFIYITHDMDEILAVSDRITVLRNGSRIATERTDDLDKSKLFQLSFSAVYNQLRSKDNEPVEVVFKDILQSALNDCSEGFIFANADFRIKFINFAAIAMLGLNEKYGYDNILELIRSKFPAYSASMTEKLLGKTKFEFAEVFFDDKRLRIGIIPICYADQDVNGSCLVLEDLSRNLQIQDYMINAEKMTSMAEITAGIAHEINNPLFIIKNYLELLTLSLQNSECRTYVDKIDNEVNRIIRISNSILSFSKVKKAEKGNFNICELIDEALLLLDYRIKEKDINVRKNYAAKEPLFFCDGTSLVQCFFNILQNSIEAVLEKGIIEIEVSDQAGCLAISILDNGYGIQDDVLKKIFIPFFSTKINKKNAGIGLSISRRIIESMNGEITAYMTEDARTCFTIKLQNMPS